MINQTQIKQFFRANNQLIIIFFAEYYQLKKNYKNIMQYKLLFNAQNEEKNCTCPDRLFYSKKTLTNFLVNQCISIGIVNEAKVIVYKVMPQFNGKFLVSYYDYANIDQLYFKDLIQLQYYILIFWFIYYCKNKLDQEYYFQIQLQIFFLYF